MKISQIAAKPQLIKIEINDEATVKEFGEAVEFWTWDRQPLDVFMKLASVDQSNPVQVIDVVRTLILNEDGTQVIQGDQMLPTRILMAVIQRIVETLGK
jgi:hypothetical protein